MLTVLTGSPPLGFTRLFVPAQGQSADGADTLVCLAVLVYFGWEILIEMNLLYKAWIVIAMATLACLSASAAEMAHLRNGFDIRHQHHELLDNVTRLYLTSTLDNYVDVPTAEILEFEEVDSPTAPSPVPSLALTPAASLDAVVSAASTRNNIDPDLIFSMIRAESGFNPAAV